MSIKYSHSPSLRLAIARSRTWCLLHRVLCLLVMFGLYRVAERGYPGLLLLLLPLAAVCCWQLARQPLAGSVLCWQRGQWFIGRGAAFTPVTLQRSSTCLSRVIYLAWLTPADSSRGRALLFPDSVPGGELRRLRVRLTLQR